MSKDIPSFVPIPRLDLDKILRGIDNSPLDDEVKEVAKEVIKYGLLCVEKISQRYATEEMIQGDDYIGMATQNIIDLLSPGFLKMGVPGPNGNDTFRHIYRALGGKNPLNWEVSSEPK